MSEELDDELAEAGGGQRDVQKHQLQKESLSITAPLSTVGRRYFLIGGVERNMTGTESARLGRRG